MPDPCLSEEEVKWHRKTAATANNRAWELSVQERTPAESEEMLIAACTSAWHWHRIGTELHRARATMLLAEVSALLGRGPQAWSYAEQLQEFYRRSEAPDWESALLCVICAHAAYADGRGAEHRFYYEKAVTLLAAVSSEEERSIVGATFAHVPRP